ncbi:YbaK/EbsC family protein [Clostridium sp. OS1-26]|uniref:YbaK/EbsC family protein n=1 Tax=Clostridium sp. OS1-26 TaxID=3070681 RepID=UPI0027E04428|nr:YbaK/EbsC family protein [Clostridium sp. OS1-26]WML37075.1 YbaK/EbsC family protein [Clostridium sp. OS1-26]
MSVENVRNFFKERNLEDPVFELEDSGATVELAAQVIGVEAKLIAKTLAFKLKEKDILVVTRGDARIDNKKFRTFFKTKAKMLDLNEVEEITGHPVGGVCPFGLKNPLEVYVDISIKDFDFVYPAAGSRTTALKISPENIQDLTNAEWIDVCQKELA